MLENPPLQCDERSVRIGVSGGELGLMSPEFVSSEFRVENIEDPLMREIRYLDNLVDELARARKWRRFCGRGEGRWWSAPPITCVELSALSP